MANISKLSEAMREFIESERAAGVNVMDANEVLQDQAFLTAGEGRGMLFHLLDNEVITFPKPSEMSWRKDEKTLNGKSFIEVRTLVSSSLRGLMWVPGSVFRKVPQLQEEQDLLFNNNDLGRTLAASELSDYQRLRKAATNGSIRVVKSLTLHTAKFVTNPDTGVREKIDDDVNMPEPQRRKLICYQFATK